MNKNRESGIELLRIICMIGVIVLHINLNGIVTGFKSNDTASYYYSLLLESIFICAVDIFILISGYFSYKTESINLKKPFKLLLQLVFIRIAYELLQTIICGDSFSYGTIIPNDYFIIFYITLLVLAPLVSKGVYAVQNQKKLLIILLIVFSVYPTIVDCFTRFMSVIGHEISDLSNITRFGSMDGYTIVNFVVLFMIGMSLRYFELTTIKRRSLLTCIASNTLITFVGVCLENNLRTDFYLGISLSYCNPFIILNSICIFLLFNRIKLNSRFINALASGCFTVYLLHERIITLVIKSYNFGIGFAHTFAFFLISPIIIYLVCYVISVMYSFIIENLLFKKVIERLPVIKY